MTNILQISYPLCEVIVCVNHAALMYTYMFTCMSRADELSRCCHQGDGERAG